MGYRYIHIYFNQKKDKVWMDGSARKVFAVKARGSEFEFLDPV